MIPLIGFAWLPLVIDILKEGQYDDELSYAQQLSAIRKAQDLLFVEQIAHPSSVN